jgi:cytochrome b
MRQASDLDAGEGGGSQTPTPIRVWDLPVRLSHGLFILLIAAAWWTESHGQMDWHIRIGCALIGVLIFRLLWGLFGGSTARFSAFLRGPVAVVGYARKLARGEPTDPSIGHNPMGGWSVAALLGAMTGQVCLGLFSVDTDGLVSGPLADRVSFDQGRFAAHWHGILFNILLGLIGLHLCAVAFYALIRRETLVGAMVTGERRVLPGSTTDVTKALAPAPIWRFRVAVIIGLAASLWAGTGFKV